MKNTFFKYLLCLVTIITLQACISVGLPQYDSIAQRMAPSMSELDEFTWQLEFDDYRADVIAVNLPNGTGFTSKAGDAVLFSRNKITLIGSMAGQKKVITFKEVTNATSELSENEFVEQILVDDQLYEVITCNPILTTIQKNTIQRCQGEFEYVTHITYQNGQLVKIEQDIPFYNKRLVLRK